MFAMFEKDYIMRLIKECVRMLLKMLFNIDTTVPVEQIIEASEQKQLLESLLLMIDQGKICEAENEIYNLTSEGDKKYLKTALIFYYRLAEMGEETLQEHNFSLDEVKEGVEALAERYGVTDLSSVFLN